MELPVMSILRDITCILWVHLNTMHVGMQTAHFDLMCYTKRGNGYSDEIASVKPGFLRTQL